MADAKIDLQPPIIPADTSTPDQPETLSQPDKSFNDDVIVARMKAHDAAVQHGIQEGGQQFVKDELLHAQEQVAPSTQYRGAQADDPQARQARLFEQKRGINAQDGQEISTPHLDPNSDTAWQIEERLLSLLADLETLAQQYDKVQHAKTAKSAAVEAKLQAILKHLLQTEWGVKQQLQLLLCGGAGFHWLGDPRLTFKRLFDRWRTWPRHIHPGYRPETDEDFNAFFAWIFAPPDTVKDEPALEEW